MTTPDPGRYAAPWAPAPGAHAPGPYPPPGAVGVRSGAGPRPVQVTAAAVLAFVVGGLGLLAGLLLLVSGGFLVGTFAVFGGAVILTAVLTAAVAAVYVWAGSKALTGSNGKLLAMVAIIGGILQFIGMLRAFDISGLISVAVSVAIVALLMSEPSKTWFRAKGAPTM